MYTFELYEILRMRITHHYNRCLMLTITYVLTEYMVLRMRLT